MKNWLTIGMSKYETPGFEDTSRFMTRAFPGRAAYVEPPRAFRAWRWLERPVATWQTRTVDEVDVYTPPLPVPGRIDPLRLTLRLQAARLHRRLAARWGERWRDETIVYVTNWTPYQQRFISLLGPRYVVFDLVDDVLSFPYQMDEAAVWQAWRKLAEAATAVLAVSPELVQMAETQLGVSAHLLPNGVDFERFQAPAGAVQWDAQRDEREGVPEDRGLSAGEGIREAAPSGEPRHRRVGFAGTLNHWIDFDLLGALANAFPEVEFQLMGRVGTFASDAQRAAYEALLAQENVHYLGMIPYAHLPEALHSVDVLLLPRRMTPASAASNPLKLYEYLAVGKPIVTACVPVPADARTLVYTATGDTAEAAAALRLALDEAAGRRPSRRAERQAYAQQHSWRNRVEMVVDRVRAASRAR
ncbi:MAG: glycosyltransferase [Alicyclobacillus sp.]|nr:glycosyltransferase [Alicyclobacillus sp.]